MPGALAPSDKAAQLERGSLGVKAFQRQIVQTTSKNEADDYRGDKIAFKSMCIVPAKRLAPALLAKNYFHHYLNYLECPDELQRRDQFMSANLERNRFPQSAGPWQSTITQVTAAAPFLVDLNCMFESALCNIFSAALKPIDTEAFLRGVRARFKVTRYEAFTRGQAGFFRQDVPESLAIRKVDSLEQEYKQGQCVFGSIILVCVHHRAHNTSHTVFSVARGPFKAPLQDAATSLPSRVCISWVPGVNMEEVEAWWSDLMQRPCLQHPLEQGDAESLRARFTEEQFEVQKPMHEGVRVIKVGVSTYVQAALQSEFSDIVADLCKPVAAAKLPLERLVITDEDLMHDPIQTVQSSLPDFDLDD